MLNIDIVNSTIAELEQGDTNYTACDKLASLYVIRHFFNAADEVKKELSDILPHYDKYCETKRAYQLNKIDSEPMLKAFTSAVTELIEFIHTLYSSTDTPEERQVLCSMLSDFIKSCQT